MLMKIHDEFIDKLDFAKRDGLIPVVVQDINTKDILMLAYANRTAIENTVKTGNAWFWSVSRNKLWMKGEESGNIQDVKDILVDCDLDSVVYLVDSKNPACHTGNRTCFHNRLYPLRLQCYFSAFILPNMSWLEDGTALELPSIPRNIAFYKSWENLSVLHTRA